MINNNNKQIDWLITLLPFTTITSVAALLFIYPNESNKIILSIRSFLSDTLGIFYLVIGLLILAISIYLCCSKFSNITLGEPDESPKYSFFSWGSMIFTCGLAADILFYSFTEWILYATNQHITELGNIHSWAGVFPLFHWSFIPWSFYLVLAVVFGFMIHVRKRTRQRFSEACKPLIGNHANRIIGRTIDMFAVFALLAGTATTFSIATPLLCAILMTIFNLNFTSTTITIIILLFTCCIYTYTTLYGFKGMQFLAKICISLFFILLSAIFLIGNQTKFILENGLQSFGIMLQHFLELATYTDPVRTTNFPQDYTIYYWAYWMVWCIATPFFIANISKGRTIKEIIIGGYTFGAGSTLLSFIILGNYALGIQLSGSKDFISEFLITNNLYELILHILNTLPASNIIIITTLLCMILFYATSFDSIAYIASCYSYKYLDNSEHPDKFILLIWCIMLIILPIALAFSESSMASIQSISIISAFPIGIIMLMMIYSFFKDSKQYLIENKHHNLP